MNNIPEIQARIGLRKDTTSEWLAHASENYFFDGEVIASYDEQDGTRYNYQIKVAAKDNSRWSDLGDSQTFYAGRGAGVLDASPTNSGILNTVAQSIGGEKTFEKNITTKEYVNIYKDTLNYFLLYSDHLYVKNVGVGATFRFPEEGGTFLTDQNFNPDNYPEFKGDPGVGYNWRGSYDASNPIGYFKNDTVEYQGSLYVCTSEQQIWGDFNGDYWDLMAEKGARGEQGVKGDKGDKGDPGEQGVKGQPSGIRWRYSNVVTPDGIQSGYFRFNASASSPESITTIYINNTCFDTQDMAGYLGTWSNGSLTILGSDNGGKSWDNSEILIFKINSITEQSGYFALSVTYLSGSSDVVEIADICFFQFSKAGSITELVKSGVGNAITNLSLSDGVLTYTKAETFALQSGMHSINIHYNHPSNLGFEVEYTGILDLLVDKTIYGLSAITRRLQDNSYINIGLRDINGTMALLSDIPVPDESLSSLSTNAVQNKTIYNALNLKADKASPFFTGTATTENLIVNGDFTVNGTNTIVNTETVSTKDNLIQLARDNTAALTNYVGFYVNNYDGTNSGAIVFDATGTAYVGDVVVNPDGTISPIDSGATSSASSLQPLATRNSTIAHESLVEWDNINKTLKGTTSNYLKDIGGELNGSFKFNTAAYKGIYWGEQHEDSAAHSGTWAYIRQAASGGQLEIGSDALVTFFETDSRARVGYFDLNNKFINWGGDIRTNTKFKEGDTYLEDKYAGLAAANTYSGSVNEFQHDVEVHGLFSVHHSYWTTKLNIYYDRISHGDLVMYDIYYPNKSGTFALFEDVATLENSLLNGEIITDRARKDSSGNVLNNKYVKYNEEDVITNGDFSDGTTGWVALNAVAEVNNNEITLTNTSGASVFGIYSANHDSKIVGHSYYIKVNISVPSITNFIKLNEAASGSVELYNTVPNEYQMQSMLYEYDDGENANTTIYYRYGTVNSQIKIKDVHEYDVTALVAAGLTKEDLDILFENPTEYSIEKIKKIISGNQQVGNALTFNGIEGGMGTGTNAFHIGHNTTSNGDNSVAVGYASASRVYGGSAFGYNASAGGYRAVALGCDSNAIAASTAVGGYSYANKDYAIALGNYAKSYIPYLFSVDGFNTSNTPVNRYMGLKSPDYLFFRNEDVNSSKNTLESYLNGKTLQDYLDEKADNTTTDALDTRVTQNENDIRDNSNDISSNSTKINTNTSNISSNTNDITTNTNSIASITHSIASIIHGETTVGYADYATRLATSKGSSTIPVYFDDGVPKECDLSSTYLGIAGTATNSDKLGGRDDDYYIYGTNASGSGSASNVWVQTDKTQYKSGFWNVNAASWMPSSGYWWGVTIACTDNTPSYLVGAQMAFSNSTSPEFKYRGLTGGASVSTGSWKTVANLEDTQTFSGTKTFSSINNNGEITGGHIRSSIIDIHPENSGSLLTYYTNDLANFYERGGTMTITGVNSSGVATSPSLSSPSNSFDGTPSYSVFSGVSLTDVITLNLVLPQTYSWTSNFGIGFGNSGWRAKDVIIESGYYNGSTTVWKTVLNVTNSIHGTLNVRSGGPGTSEGGTSDGKTNRMRITLTNFNSSIQRIAQIWLVNYRSKGLGSAYMLRAGGEMFGTMYPYKDTSYDLGKAANEFRSVYATTLYEGGVSLSSKYLGINATAANALKLGGTPAADYALKTDIPSLSGYATEAGLNNFTGTNNFSGDCQFTGYTTLGTTTINDLWLNECSISAGEDTEGISRLTVDGNNVALISDIPDVSGIATNANDIDDILDGTQIVGNANKLGGVGAASYVKYSTDTKNIQINYNSYNTQGTRYGYIVNDAQMVGQTNYTFGKIEYATYSYFFPQKTGTLAMTSDIPSLSGYATEDWVNNKGYLTLSSNKITGTSFNGTYPLVVNVDGKLYSDGNIKYTGSSDTFDVGNIVATTIKENGTLLSNKYAAKKATADTYGGVKIYSDGTTLHIEV